MKTLLALALLAAAGTSAAAQATTCPSGNEDIRVSALMTISQLEADQAIGVLQKVLERRDECSVTLRRQAVQLLSRTRDPERVDIMLRVARADASPEVRRAAVQTLAQINNPRVAAALDSVLYNTKESDIQEAVLRALAQQSAPTARESMHRAIESAALPMEVRVRAVSYLANGRRVDDETDYLRGQFAKATNQEMRDALLRAIAYQRTPAAMTFLLGIARDKNQELELRRRALSVVAQNGTSRDSYAGTPALELKDVLALYDEFKGQYEMQAQLLDTFGSRQETIVTDKLLQIAKDEGNADLRKRAVSRLGQRRDPRVREFLIGLVNQ